MGKQDFYFHQDLLVKVWQRQVFTIEAETIEEARTQAKKYTQFDVSHEDDIDVEEVQWLCDSEELIIPEDNDGDATIQVFETTGKFGGDLVADNHIENFTSINDDLLHETIADIAFNFGWEHHDEMDSRDMVRCIIRWAKEFEELHRNTDWTTRGDYLTEIDEFAADKIADYLLGNK